jgi:hypothetical protein
MEADTTDPSCYHAFRVFPITVYPLRWRGTRLCISPPCILLPMPRNVTPAGVLAMRPIFIFFSRVIPPRHFLHSEHEYCTLRGRSARRTSPPPGPVRVECDKAYEPVQLVQIQLQMKLEPILYTCNAKTTCNTIRVIDVTVNAA